MDVGIARHDSSISQSLLQRLVDCYHNSES
jgi:hypothetical protein